MIKYIGSKRLLVPHIVRAMSAFPESGRVLDLFSGTSRVARGLKESGRHVIANDHLAYAATLARCYVQADAARWLHEATQLIAELATVAPGAWLLHQSVLRGRAILPAEERCARGCD